MRSAEESWVRDFSRMLSDRSSLPALLVDQQLLSNRDVDEQDVADVEFRVRGLLKWNSHLLRSDVLFQREQFLKTGIIADRIPNGIDF